jgi:putative ABC transport system permease protein
MTDLKFAIRQLLKSPGFTTVAVLTLALGIGVNTSMFTALQAVLSRSLPYPEPGQLVQVFQESRHWRREPHHSPANFLDYKSQASDFRFIAAMNDKPFNLVGAGQLAERVFGLQVTTDFFQLLGIQPELGRVFTPDDAPGDLNQVVVLDHDFWVRRYSADPTIIGQTLRLDGETVTVIGVMPARSHDIMLTGPVSLWRPLVFTEAERQNRGANYLKLIARLRPELTLAQAQAGVDVLATRLAHDTPENSPEKLKLVALSSASLPPEGRRVVWCIMGLAGFVLLIACANLANLLFARTAARSREIAIRGALGAPRRRLIRCLLTECLLLALLGGGLGLVLANWSNQLLSRQLVFEDETILKLPLNLKALGFALAASTASGLVFGLLPAWLASRTSLNEVLQQGSRGSTSDRSHHRLQHSLIVAEVALALVLLAGAGLVVSGLREYAALNPGWRVDGLVLGSLTLPNTKYGNGDAQRRFTERLQEKLASLPGVQEVALAWNIPLRQFNVTASFTPSGRFEIPKGQAPVRHVNGVTPGYFHTLGMRLMSGRDFNSFDTSTGPPVVIINQAMARVFWGDESPLGKRIDGEEIVGVVNNVNFPANPAERITGFQTYRPWAQVPQNSLAVALRGSISADTLRRAVAQVDPDQPVGDAGPAPAQVRQSLANWAVGGKVLSGFAVLGLSLAALGIYGVASGFVVRRTPEIGIRMALGARAPAVLWLVVGSGLRLSLIGTVIGFGGAFVISRLLQALLPELPANNPFVVLLVAGFLIAVTLLASWLPARRATRIDPLAALRSE